MLLPLPPLLLLLLLLLWKGKWKRLLLLQRASRTWSHLLRPTPRRRPGALGLHPTVVARASWSCVSL